MTYLEKKEIQKHTEKNLVPVPSMELLLQFQLVREIPIEELLQSPSSIVSSGDFCPSPRVEYPAAGIPFITTDLVVKEGGGPYIFINQWKKTTSMPHCKVNNQILKYVFSCLFLEPPHVLVAKKTTLISLTNNSPHPSSIHIPSLMLYGSPFFDV